jgi:23S rRNA (adenine-N6)-dimethyltransferase
MKRNISHSQNRIKRKDLVRRLISLPEVELKSDTLMEIGAGTGMIAYELVRLFPNKIIKLIELDIQLARRLRSKFRKSDRIEVINKNFVKCQLPKEKFDVFSNIPFNYTSDILRKLTAVGMRMQNGYLVMQKEAAIGWGGSQLDRVVGETLKSLSIYPFFTCELIYEFQKSDFEPVPSVDCVLAKFERRQKPLIDKNNRGLYQDFIGFIAEDRVGEGNWKVIFTNRQLDYMCRNYGLVKGRGIGSQRSDVLLKVFESFKKYVSQEKKLELVNSQDIGTLVN